MMIQEIVDRYDEINSDSSVAEMNDLLIDIDNAIDDHSTSRRFLNKMKVDLEIRISVVCYQLTCHEDF